ncbi:Uu.00g007410.m01.CDS01 [Anthostomella pinea]|uniref:Uu.00g007410.m01.CDS01 n=1 Tax=Anthostomella pinea TaxID=933095 RepID=A0AAI8VWY2_9PEZI|nr:Uu.00g007410.m01.CDS01 [Anthostomella pinea]
MAADNQPGRLSFGSEGQASIRDGDSHFSFYDDMQRSPSPTLMTRPSISSLSTTTAGYAQLREVNIDSAADGVDDELDPKENVHHQNQALIDHDGRQSVNAHDGEDEDEHEKGSASGVGDGTKAAAEPGALDSMSSASGSGRSSRHSSQST